MFYIWSHSLKMDSNYQELFYHCGKSKTHCDCSTNPNYIFPYIRGLFDSNGTITSKTKINKCLSVSIRADSAFIDFIVDNMKGITYTTLTKEYVEYQHLNALEFLHRIYKKSDARYRSNFNYEKYIDWAVKPENDVPICHFEKNDENAVVPFKHRISDVGYDLTIIRVVKVYGSKITMFDTGIKVKPPIGYYTKIVPRSSLIKSGYILSNSVGIIDSGYQDTLKICLTKIDSSLPDLELPFTCCQLILEKLNHFEMTEHTYEPIFKNPTSRGLGGFGSTDILHHK